MEHAGEAADPGVEGERGRGEGVGVGVEGGWIGGGRGHVLERGVKEVPVKGIEVWDDTVEYIFRLVFLGFKGRHAGSQEAL